MGGEFLQTSRPVLDWVVRTTWEASLIAALVLAAQVALRGRVSARWRYNLWLLVVARLLLPVVPGSHYSPFNLVQLPQAGQDSRPAAVRARTAPRLNPTLPPRVIPVPGPAQEPEKREPLYLASDVPAEPLAVVPMEPVVAAAPAPLLALPSEVAVNPTPSTARASAPVLPRRQRAAHALYRRERAHRSHGERAEARG